MTTYKLLNIEANSAGVWVRSTDSDTLSWIADEVKRYMSSARSEILLSLRSNEVFGIRLSNLQNRDIEMAYWIMKQLCAKGWEPFFSSSDWQWVHV